MNGCPNNTQIHSVDMETFRCGQEEAGADFARFLAEYGFTEEAVRASAQYLGDHIDMPAEFTKLKAGPSNIEGRGMFAVDQIAAGELIAPVRIDGLRTPAGRRLNHSPTPNCRVQADDSENLSLVAALAIRSGEELTVDFRQVASVNTWVWSPNLEESMATLRSRIEPGQPWSWIAEQEADLPWLLRYWIDRFGFLPSINMIGAAAVVRSLPESNEAVAALSEMLLTLPQTDLGTQHLVHAGMYARTIFIPSGTVLTGALTNVDNICVVHGDITVTTDDGPQRLTGFHVLPASSGNRRAGMAHADTWWTTVWRTDLTDVQAIEDSLTPEADKLQTRRDLLEVHL